MMEMAKVQVIAGSVVPISCRKPPRPMAIHKKQIKRIAVYCRVSTENESQESSFENQMKFFTERISREKNWSLAGVYADHGITGTSLRNRTEFNRMIADCEAGKIDTILTKGVSRFARNTVDLLAVVRRLKEIGINVIFDSQKLDTALETSELLLTILAAMAQEGSRSISENIRWSKQKKYQLGEVEWHPVFGYRRDELTGTPFIPDGRCAQAVRRIFGLYVDGHTTLEIMRIMQDEGWPTPNERGVWYNKSVCNILSNEKYRGDALLQKSYVYDLLSHKRLFNDRGEKPSYYVRNHHEPLVDEKMYERAQIIRRLRCTHDGCPQYPYAGRMVCPHCGAFLRQTPIFAQGSRSGWFCMECGGFAIRTSYLDKAVMKAYQIHVGKPAQRVAYGWLDELVKEIRLTETGISVVWKDESLSVIEINYQYPRERPAHISALLRKQYNMENKQEQEAK